MRYSIYINRKKHDIIMPIFTKNKLSICFVHIPKCGGTSVEQLLVRNGWDMFFYDASQKSTISGLRFNSPQHCTMEQLDAIFDMQKFDLIFSLVRKPLARVRSEYNWQCSYHKTTLPFQEWLPQVLTRSKNDPKAYDSHLMPATDFIDDRVDVFRLEDQTQQLISRLRQLEPKISDLPHLNKTSDRVEEDAVSIDLVKAHFRSDYVAYYPESLAI